MNGPKQAIRSGDLESSLDLSSGRTYEFELRRFQCFNLEIEDIHFHHDSAVLLPDYEEADDGTDGQQRERITAFTLLAACFNQIQEHPAQKILVTGHTDTTGTRSYNLLLSRQRALNVAYMLKGDRAGWVSVCIAKHKVEDYQQILKWLFRDWGWDCDPGLVDNNSGPQTRDAITHFKRRYNSEFSASIGLSSVVDAATWGAFFDLYSQELQEQLGVDAAGLTLRREGIQSLPGKPEAVGCGENFPIEQPGVDDFESKTNRRVEIVFFDPGEEPALLCHPDGDHCLPDQCDLFDDTCFLHNPLTVAPALPHALRMPVYLALKYKDPAGTERPFPEGLGVLVEYASGMTQNATTTANGRLHFDADRREASFTLRFDYVHAPYISAAPAGAPVSDVLVQAVDAEARAAEGHKLFRMPPASGLGNMDWTLTGATNYTAPNFTALDSTPAVGNPASPARMVLDPHWQYLKFLYYDRTTSSRSSILPIFIEAYPNRNDTLAEPPIRSNWVTEPEACHCLPWILRTPVKPDNNILIQFRTPAHTYIKTADDGSRTLESGTAQNVPDRERLRYYDLPEIWKSRGYFAHLSNGAGVAAARRDFFESLASEATTDAKPLIFCLDDIVLTDASLQPVAWAATDRAAIFSHTFTTGPNLSPLGIYKPDTANHLPWFSQQVDSLATANYIADYPYWTRLVAYKGNLHDVFDQRTPDSIDKVVGARAAVAWVNATASPNYIAIGSDFTAGSRPALVNKPFFSIQPFHEQRHDAWFTATIGDDRGTGRYDLAVLRCCGIDGDNEVAVCLEYFRFCFNFNSPLTPNFNPSAVALGLTGATANAWVENAIANIPNRWNGNDAFSINIPWILPKDAAGPKFKAKVIWFMQSLATALSHFEMGVFQESVANQALGQNVRAYMNASSGRGVLDRSDNVATATGWFTTAHEVGHGGSLGDEYLERWSDRSCSYEQAGAGSYSPGAPFDTDASGMMRGNINMRARYFWHVAEWLHSITTTNYKISLGAKNFSLPTHPNSPARNHVNWPFREVRNFASGRGLMDIYFYPLGEDFYSAGYLPANDYDGIIIITVKMRFTFHTNAHATIHPAVLRFFSLVKTAFNDKFRASGTIGSQTFNKCLLFFSPRFLVDTLSDSAAYAQSMQVTNQGQYTTKVDAVEAIHGIHFRIDTQATGATAWDAANQHHLTLTLDGTEASQIPNRFAEMLGVAAGARGTAASYQTLVRQVLPGAIVSGV